MNTTQKTYLHIIQELENQDVDLVMRSISASSRPPHAHADEGR